MILVYYYQTLWWWLCPHLRGFWGKVIHSLPAHFLFFFEWRSGHTYPFHFLGQDQSTVAQQAKTTVSELSLTSRMWACFSARFPAPCLYHTVPDVEGRESERVLTLYLGTQQGVFFTLPCMTADSFFLMDFCQHETALLIQGGGFVWRKVPRHQQESLVNILAYVFVELHVVACQTFFFLFL